MEILKMRELLQTANHELGSAEADEASISGFLANARAGTQQEALLEQTTTRDELERERAKLERLRTEVDPEDPDTDLTRDLLLGGRHRLDAARADLKVMTAAMEDRRNLLAGIRQDLSRLQRARDASDRLATIEFVVCPRCSQSIKNREIPADVSRLCTQPDAVAASSVGTTELDSYEARQLKNQAEEVELILEAAEQEKSSLEEYIVAISEDVDRLARELDARTRDLVIPRLQAFSDASAAIARKETRLTSLEETRRLWDGLADVQRRTIVARDTCESLGEQISILSSQLEDRKSTFLTELSGEYQRVVTSLGVPGVDKAVIDHRRYLPFVDGRLFDSISTGGIRTALVVAYWVTLLGAAVRDATTDHPALLILDSPRKSIGAGEALAANLYRQLNALADAYGDSVQIIVADNQLTTDYSKRWQEIGFDYKTRPVIYTVPHPGPASVKTIDAIAEETNF